MASRDWPIRSLMIFLLAFMISGCSEQISSFVGEVKDQMVGLLQIKKAVDDTLDSGQCGIHIQNGKVITLSLVNTRYNHEDASVRESKADEVAGILVESLAGRDEYDNVDTLVVRFVRHEKKFAVVDFTHTIDHYVFQLTESNDDMASNDST